MAHDPFDLVGDVLEGRFRVASVAGQGDWSVVYQGQPTGVGVPVAIKCLVLPTTLDGALVRPLVERFREASRLHHGLSRGNAHIAQSIASGSTLAPASGMIVPYLVREWLVGESLAAELARRRQEGKAGRPVEEVVALLETAAYALAHAHAEGAVHLSVNPANLFLAEKEGRRSLKVLDFGVSRAMNELGADIPAASRPPSGLRTLFAAYAAPEQLDASAGEVGPWTDVYALARVFVELLTDRVPAPEHGRELPRNLDVVLGRALSPAPARRHRNARDFWSDVNTSLRVGGSRRMQAPPAPRQPDPPPPAVVGAVPARRVEHPLNQSVETIPLGIPPPARPQAPIPRLPSEPTLPDQPPVHVVATPPPPGPPPPDLPPVIVAVDSVPGVKAMPPPTVPHLEAGAGVDRAPTFPVIDTASPPRRSHRALLTIVAGVVGLSLGVGTIALVKRHASAQAASPSEAPPPAASLPVASGASADSSPSPPASAPSATAPAASGTPSAAPAPTDTPAPSAHFPAIAAQAALDVAGRDVVHCKRGKVWGIASANVTFGPDGTVSKVAVGVPFTGTSTGQCIADALSTAKVPPFAGKPVVVPYRFFVAAK